MQCETRERMSPGPGRYESALSLVHVLVATWYAYRPEKTGSTELSVPVRSSSELLPTRADGRSGVGQQGGCSTVWSDESVKSRSLFVGAGLADRTGHLGSV